MTLLESTELFRELSAPEATITESMTFGSTVKADTWTDASAFFVCSAWLSDLLNTIVPALMAAMATVITIP